jgi:hypothetical protein
MARVSIRPRGRREVWYPVAFTPAEAQAAKAIERGEASPEMQRRFFDWLITACRMRDEIFVPGQEDVRTYLLGRRSVGLQIAELLQWREPEAGP